MRALVFIAVLNALGLVSTYPIAAKNNEGCLVVTPERQNQINEIAEKIGEFIENLTSKYEDIDISAVKLTFEKHVEEKQKETIITVDINECSDDAESVESEVIKDFKDGKHLDKDKVDEIGGIYGEISIKMGPLPTAEDFEEYVYAPSTSCSQTKPVAAEVMTLELNEEQEKVVQALESSRPGPLVLLQRETPRGEEILLF